MSVLPPPNLLGAPARYNRWRTMQAEAVWAAAESKKRFNIINAPVGFGKSLLYMCTALLTNSRAFALTATKALMTQNMDDYRESGLIEIRGLNSYPCVEGTPTGRFGDMRREGFRADQGLPMMCDEAPCQSGAMCPKRGGGCEYYDAYARACDPSNKLVQSNYAYWMSIHKYGEGLGKVDTLICDEAHSAFDELGNFIGTEMYPGEVEALMPGVADARTPPPGTSQEEWQEWAGHWLGEVMVMLERIKIAIRQTERPGHDRTGERISYSTLRRARDLKRVQVKLETIAGMRGDWIIDYTEDHRKRDLVKFNPVWPGEYAEQYLFLGVPKIIMVSATINRKTASMFGIEPGDVDYREYKSTFPKKNRPIIFVPAGPMNRNSEAESIPKIATMVDNIVGRRLDRKGIIHTTSYKRATELYRRSQYRDMMILHDSNNTKEKIAQFRESRQPVILVSPVLDTGYDFKYEQAEYQIIIKVPFPVAVDKVVQARAKRDPEYKDYVTAIDLAQMVGRIVRAEDDTGECVSPETRVLTDDLRWVQAGDIELGSRLLSFDEEGPAWAPRRWRWSTVERSLIRKMHRVRVITRDMDLICTPNHPWLVYSRTAGQYRTLQWKRADQLTNKDDLVKVLQPWQDNTSWDAGWMAGFADGEGCLVTKQGKRNPNVGKITLSQNIGPTLRFAESTLDKLGFVYHTHKKTGFSATDNGYHVDIRGGWPELLRFLGQVRPQRLLNKFMESPRNEVMKRLDLVRVVTVEKLVDGPIASLQTSHKTYVAEGFGAHNTFIIDSDFGWWYSKRGHRLVPQSFAESVQQQQILGPPLPKIRKVA